MASFQDRVIGAIKLQPATFEDVEHDRTATTQAAAVVAMSGLASGLASAWYFGLTATVMAVILQLIGWVVGSFVILMIGTKLLPGKNTQADLGEMLRTAGFAQSAGLFGVLGVVPILGSIVRIVVSIWILVAMVVAVRQALDYEDTTRAIIVCVVAWAVFIVITMLGALLGLTGAVLTSAAY